MSPTSVRMTTRTAASFFAGSSAAVVTVASASSIPTAAKSLRRIHISASDVDDARVEPDVAAESDIAPEPVIDEPGVVIDARVNNPRVVVTRVVVGVVKVAVPEE